MKGSRLGTLPKLELHLMGCPLDIQLASTRSVAGVEIPSQRIVQGSSMAMTCSFESCFEKLGKLDRMFPEPDGSFMWIGFDGDKDWQLNGMVYDREQAVQWCEIKGACPLGEWHTLLGCFGWPEQSMLAQFPTEQMFAKVEDLDALWQLDR